MTQLLRTIRLRKTWFGLYWSPYLSAEVYEGYMYLDDCCVKEGFRSRGIGTALFALAEAYGNALSLPIMLLHAETENADAIRLYRVLGFSPAAEEGSRLKMVKHL